MTLTKAELLVEDRRITRATKIEKVIDSPRRFLEANVNFWCDDWPGPSSFWGPYGVISFFWFFVTGMLWTINATSTTPVFLWAAVTGWAAALPLVYPALMLVLLVISLTVSMPLTYIFSKCFIPEEPEIMKEARRLLNKGEIMGEYLINAYHTSPPKIFNKLAPTILAIWETSDSMPSGPEQDEIQATLCTLTKNLPTTDWATEVVQSNLNKIENRVNNIIYKASKEKIAQEEVKAAGEAQALTQLFEDLTKNLDELA